MSTRKSDGTDIRIRCLFSLMLVFTACSKEAVEWIDVPLAENVFYEDSLEYQADTIRIPVFANSDLEYMLDMKLGNAVSYHWYATDLSDATKLLVEFHGHTIRTSDEPGDVMFYQQGRSESAEGYLVAPFDGVHGWYLSNETNSDITVTLSLSGFYTIP